MVWQQFWRLVVLWATIKEDLIAHIQIKVGVRYKCFKKCSRKVASHEIFYICLTFRSILLVISTSISLVNISALFMINKSDVVQKCPALIRKMWVDMSDVVKNLSWTLYNNLQNATCWHIRDFVQCMVAHRQLFQNWFPWTKS